MLVSQFLLWTVVIVEALMIIALARKASKPVKWQHR